MSVTRYCPRHRRVLKQRITRHARVPFSDDDPEMENGWRCIPIPPTDDGCWFILDSSRDYKNGLGMLA
jgi:hypothetical protein